MSEIETLNRVFFLGAVRLADPAPQLPAEEAVKMYESVYPQVGSCRLGEPERVNDELHYKIEKPPVETKG